MREKSEISLRIDRIEDSLYRDLKQLGFRKYGRTLHRFFLDDISQVIRFQCGQAYREETHLLCVGVGIRVPECDRTASFWASRRKNTTMITSAISVPALVT